MLQEYDPFSSETKFLDQIISDLIDETIEARGIVPAGFPHWNWRDAIFSQSEACMWVLIWKPA